MTGFEQHAGSIYRVDEWWDGLPGREPGGEAAAYIPVGPAMKQDFPDVDNFVRFQGDYGEKFVRVDNKVSLLHLSFRRTPAFSFRFFFSLVVR